MGRNGGGWFGKNNGLLLRGVGGGYGRWEDRKSVV